MNCNWSRSNVLSTKNPYVSTNSGAESSSLPQNWPSGVIRMGSPVWKWKICEHFGINLTLRPANGTVWMPKVSKSPCRIPIQNYRIGNLIKIGRLTPAGRLPIFKRARCCLLLGLPHLKAGFQTGTGLGFGKVIWQRHLKMSFLTCNGKLQSFWW